MATIEKTNQFAPWLEEAEMQMYSNQTYTPKTFHASGYVDCGRMQVSSLLGLDATPQPVIAQYRRDASLGNVIHGILQDWAVASGKVAMLPDEKGKLQPAIELTLGQCAMNTERYKEFLRLHIGCRIDGILKRANDDLVIWEIKTLASKYLSGKYKQYLPGKLTHFEAQVQLEMHFTGIHEGLILVVNRELFLELYSGVAMVEWSDCYQEYAVTYDPLFIEPELERLARLNEYLAAKKLPEGEPHRGPCKFCLYPCELKQQ